MKKSLGRIWLTGSFIISICNVGVLGAQNLQVISLDSCLKIAIDDYPLAQQKGYLRSMNENTIKGINGSWLPQVEMVSTATYQSEVTEFDFEGFPSINFPKDQYSFGLQLTQSIYDGGLAAQQKNTALASTAVEIGKNEVELYSLREKITQLYGNILLARENIRVLNSYIENIQSHERSVSSAVSNGTMLRSNLDVLDVEILNSRQKLYEANANLQVLYNTLALYIHEQPDDSTVFEEINATAPQQNATINRPELQLFNSQKQLFDERTRLSERGVYPHVSLFANGAYGRPGYNFLDQQFRLYAIGGLSLRWNISKFYNLSYDKENYTLNKDMVDVQRDAFMLNLTANLIKQNAEIENLLQMIETDKAIVEKRMAISKSASDQLNNGLITASDYITELTAEEQAVLNQRMHEIRLSVAEMNYSITTGN